MLAMLINDRELKEMQYLLKREMDEILYDLRDERIDMMIKNEMEDRYKHLFTLFKRVADQRDCMKYLLTLQKSKAHLSKVSKKNQKSY